MREHEDVQELQAKLSRLEGDLRRIEKRRKARLRVGLITLALGMSVALAAQSSQGPLTLDSLAKRVTDLENRVAADEASGTNIPSTADNGSSSSTSKSSSGTSTSSELTTLQQQVTTLEGDVSGLMDMGIQQRFVNDELKIAHLEQAHSSSTVQAPFTVVGKGGQPILTVTGDNGSGLLSLGSGGDQANLGYTPDGPRFSLIDNGDHVYIGRRRSTTALGLYLGTGSDYLAAIDLEGGVGNVHLFKGTNQVGAFSVTDNGATLEMESSSGNQYLTSGIGDGGDAFMRVSGKGGSALLGAPPGKDFGLRLYKGASATADMLEDAQGNASIGIAKNNIMRVNMAVGGASGIVGVLDGAGKNYLSALTNYPGGGGSLQVANQSGQIVSLVDANPVNNEGRAVFTDNSGQPLAKIGVLAQHGDVQLFGLGKGLDVWLRGFLP